MPEFPPKRLFWLISNHTAVQGEEDVLCSFPSTSLSSLCNCTFLKLFFFPLPAFLFSCLTSALISLPIFPLSLLLSQIEHRGKPST